MNRLDGLMNSFGSSSPGGGNSPQEETKELAGLIREGGRISGYRLSDGTSLSLEDGVALAKAGGIRGVAVAKRQDREYLRSLPDHDTGENLPTGGIG